MWNMWMSPTDGYNKYWDFASHFGKKVRTSSFLKEDFHLIEIKHRVFVFCTQDQVSV